MYICMDTDDWPSTCIQSCSHTSCPATPWCSTCTLSIHYPPPVRSMGLADGASYLYRLLTVLFTVWVGSVWMGEDVEVCRETSCVVVVAATDQHCRSHYTAATAGARNKLASILISRKDVIGYRLWCSPQQRGMLLRLLIILYCIWWTMTGEPSCIPV